MFLDTNDLRSDELFLKLERTSDADPEKGWVPAYHFKICLIENGAEAGKCSLRAGDNENLYYGGHIGYEVYEPFRGNHYAGKACLLLLGLAGKHGMKRLYITCNPDNYASRKTCEYAGCILEAVADLPEDNEMYQRGERKKCIYSINL
ncbi:MAG: GNAT family N-acetyltransferase [Clostridiales bacterium]|jgi:predicted acetyltransferase|nr:GNAT family N-acetyltransferase [Clostridiales bacterium]